MKMSPLDALKQQFGEVVETAICGEIFDEISKEEGSKLLKRMNFLLLLSSNPTIGEKGSVSFSLLCPLSSLLVSSLPCPRPEGSRLSGRLLFHICALVKIAYATTREEV
jgi:hypothetical protein